MGTVGQVAETIHATLRGPGFHSLKPATWGHHYFQGAWGDVTHTTERAEEGTALGLH